MSKEIHKTVRESRKSVEHYNHINNNNKITKDTL